MSAHLHRSAGVTSLCSCRRSRRRGLLAVAAGAAVLCNAFPADSPAAARPDGPGRDADDQPEGPLRPVITEVYFNVIKGDEGDATGDGVRHATGDEFIELWNPHSKPIELEGYVLMSRLVWHAEDHDTRYGVTFTFPDFTMEPDDVVLVFNGEGSRVPGPRGTPRKAHKDSNENFHDAHVFVSQLGSKNRSFANGGDFVLLLDPEGRLVEGVVWGDPDPPPPPTEGEDDEGDPVEIYRLHDVDKTPDGSVHRVIDEKGRLRPFTNTRRFNGDPFNPGLIMEDMDRPDDDE